MKMPRDSHSKMPHHVLVSEYYRLVPSEANLEVGPRGIML